MTEPIKPNTKDLHSSIIEVLTDVWDRSKQVDDATDEVLDLIEADRKDRRDTTTEAWAVIDELADDPSVMELSLASAIRAVLGRLAKNII